MAGMNQKRSALDIALGYDDEYRSSEFSRHANFILWNSADAAPGMLISVKSNAIVFRAPIGAWETHLTELVAKTLSNMTRKMS